MKVSIENLTKKFGNVVAVDSMNLEIEDGEFVAFLGPSGCGKTTTLLMVAGIYKPTAGLIRFGDSVVNKHPPKDRNIGMVFQSYALYPHMTVFGNISYPLRLQKVPKEERRRRVQEVANTMGIGQLMDRRPAQLSGGQQQRVALGRALVKQPDLLLFDEPLSNLDARLRLTMRGEIKHLQKGLGITSIYVTHDQVEAMTMADRIAVMHAGRLQAFDTPEGLYDRPKTMFVAGFVGNPPMNFLEVEIVREDGQFFAHNATMHLQVPPEHGEKAAAKSEGPIVMGIRPGDISISADGPITGEVFVVEPLGRDHMLDIHVGDTRVLVLVDPSLKVQAGDTVKLLFNTQNLQFFGRESELSLIWN